MATIYDLAKELNLSIATVSRVMNNRTDIPIADATRERVLEAVEKMHYRPNPMARALATNRTHIIGVCARSVQEMVGPHFAKMLESVESTARRLGYRVVVSNDLEAVAGDGFVDALVLIAHPTINDNHSFNIDSALLKGKACAFVRNSLQTVPNLIYWSDSDGAYQAGTYFLELGHRNIAAVFENQIDCAMPRANPQDEMVMPRVQGFRRAMASTEGVAYTEVFGKRSEDRIESGYLLTRELLHDNKDVTAVFARNDALAIGAIRAIKETGRSIPGDVSVIGYSDTSIAECADPPLTSIHTPIADAGAKAVELVIRSIEDGITAFEGMCLPTSIAVRSSCAPPKH